MAFLLTSFPSSAALKGNRRRKAALALLRGLPALALLAARAQRRILRHDVRATAEAHGAAPIAAGADGEVLTSHVALGQNPTST